MSGPEFEPEPASYRELSAGDPLSEVPENASEVPTEGSFLDEILQVTSATNGSGNEAQNRSHEGFLNLARTYRGVEFSVDPIGQALIEVVLQQTFNEQLISDEGRVTLSREIAGKLVDDPTAAPRLEAFWSKLQDAVS